MSTNPTESAARATKHHDKHTRRYELAMGFLIWGTAVVVGIGVLYWFSILAGD
jgi:hypothetical protein